MKLIKKNNIILSSIIIIIILILLVTLFFDKGLAVGLILVVVLSCLTFFILYRLGFKDKKIYLLFLIVLAIHLASTLFMHYGNFQPFSGGQGDYLLYQKSAVEASQCFKQGIFSIQGIVSRYPDFYTVHCYPIVVGVLYALTMPQEIIGLMLNVWLVALTVVFIYLIILEIGGEAKNAFVIGIATAFYPSYIFNSGLLLKDPLEICFTILGLLFLIKTVKKFTWYNFLVLFFAIFCVTHFRFYIGYALIITFILCWFLLSKINFKKKVTYGVIFIIILGFAPIGAGQGYYGISSIETFLNSKMINFYRQSMYNPNAYANHVLTNPGSNNPTPTLSLDSSFPVEAGPIGYIKSFIYTLLGPFPWQLKYLRQFLALFETIPWYLMLFFVADGFIVCFKKRIKEVVPLLLFSFMVLVVIAIFDSNYGLILRIRIPAFISLLCIGAFGFNESNIIYSFLNKFIRSIRENYLNKIKWLNI